MNIDQRLVKWAGKKKNVEVLVKSLRELVNCCYSEKIRCTDPPIASTGFLYSLGFHQYLIRTFWAELPPGVYKVPLYKYLGTEFFIEIKHEINSIREIKCGKHTIPVDELDARPRETIFTPRSHLLYIRLAGVIEGNVIKINIVRLAKLIETYEPGWVTSILDEILRSFDNPKILDDLEDKVLAEIEKRKLVLSFILPKIPKSKTDLLKLVPVLRIFSKQS
jgi:hypothetical protein